MEGPVYRLGELITEVSPAHSGIKINRPKVSSGITAAYGQELPAKVLQWRKDWLFVGWFDLGGRWTVYRSSGIATYYILFDPRGKKPTTVAELMIQENGTYSVESLFTTLEYRNRGLARSLYKWILMHDRPIESGWVQTPAANRMWKSFYEDPDVMLEDRPDSWILRKRPNPSEEEANAEADEWRDQGELARVIKVGADDWRAFHGGSRLTNPSKTESKELAAKHKVRGTYVRVVPAAAEDGGWAVITGGTSDHYMEGNYLRKPQIDFVRNFAYTAGMDRMEHAVATGELPEWQEQIVKKALYDLQSAEEQAHRYDLGTLQVLVNDGDYPEWHREILLRIMDGRNADVSEEDAVDFTRLKHQQQLESLEIRMENWPAGVISTHQPNENLTIQLLESVNSSTRKSLKEHGFRWSKRIREWVAKPPHSAARQLFVQGLEEATYADVYDLRKAAEKQMGGPKKKIRVDPSLITAILKGSQEGWFFRVGKIDLTNFNASTLAKLIQAKVSKPQGGWSSWLRRSLNGWHEDTFGNNWWAPPYVGDYVDPWREWMTMIGKEGWIRELATLILIGNDLVQYSMEGGVGAAAGAVLGGLPGPAPDWVVEQAQKDMKLAEEFGKVPEFVGEIYREEALAWRNPQVPISEIWNRVNRLQAWGKTQDVGEFIKREKLRIPVGTLWHDLSEPQRTRVKAVGWKLRAMSAFIIPLWEEETGGAARAHQTFLSNPPFRARDRQGAIVRGHLSDDHYEVAHGRIRPRSHQGGKDWPQIQEFYTQIEPETNPPERRDWTNWREEVLDGIRHFKSEHITGMIPIPKLSAYLQEKGWTHPQVQRGLVGMERERLIDLHTAATWREDAEEAIPREAYKFGYPKDRGLLYLVTIRSQKNGK